MRVVLSSQVGMGKSLFITNQAQKLAKEFGIPDPLVTIRVHGPNLAEERIMDQLQSLDNRPDNGPIKPLIVHFDIAPSVS